MILQKKESERLFQKIDKTPFCWIWRGAVKHSGGNRKNNKPYGVLTLRMKNIQAHVVTYRMFKGNIPKGLEIDHLCKNTLCVNPDHLEAVTHSENMRRSNCSWRIVQINRSKTHCPQGHEYNKENTYNPPNTNERHCRACIRNRTKIYSDKRRRKLGIKTWQERYPKSAGEI